MDNLVIPRWLRAVASERNMRNHNNNTHAFQEARKKIKSCTQAANKHEKQLTLHQQLNSSLLMNADE